MTVVRGTLVTYSLFLYSNSITIQKVFGSRKAYELILHTESKLDPLHLSVIRSDFKQTFLINTVWFTDLGKLNFIMMVRFKHESIFATAPAALKNEGHF